MKKILCLFLIGIFASGEDFGSDNAAPKDDIDSYQRMCEQELKPISSTEETAASDVCIQQSLKNKIEADSSTDKGWKKHYYYRCFMFRYEAKLRYTQNNSLKGEKLCPTSLNIYGIHDKNNNQHDESKKACLLGI